MYLFVGRAGSLLLLGLFSSCGKQGRSPVAARGLLTVAASLVEEHGLQQLRLPGFRAQRQQLWRTG